MTRPRRGRGWWFLAGIGVMLLLFGGGAGGLLPQTVAQAPAAERAQVIAQGTAWLPAEPVAWWVGEQAAAATPQSPFRQLGFIVGERGTTTVITESVLGDQLVWLDPGEALFVPRDTRQDRLAAGFAATYYALDLLPDTAAPDVPAFQGSASFLPAPGLCELSLVRAALNPGEAGTLPASAYPTLVLATSGTIAVAQDNGERYIVDAGQALSLAANVGAVITAIGNGTGTYVAATISTRAGHAPVSGVADLGLWVHTCPPGVTARPFMANAGCVLGDPLTSGVEVSITGPALTAPLTLARSEFGDAGARVWPAVPFGTYTLTATLPPGAAGYAVRPGIAGFAVELRPAGTGYTFTIDGSLFDPRSDYWRVNLDLYLLYP